MTTPCGGPDFRLAAGDFVQGIMTLPWEKIALAVLPKIIGAGVDQFTRKRWDAAWQGVYTSWKDSFQSPEAGEEKLNIAFQEFFSRKPAISSRAVLEVGYYTVSSPVYEAIAAKARSRCQTGTPWWIAIAAIKQSTDDLIVIPRRRP